MSPTAVLRRLVHVLLDPPDFPDTVAAFRFLAAADERRARGACTCMTVDHALSLTDWMSIAVALQAACEQGRTELAGYLAQRMEPCTTRGADPLMDALFEIDRPPAPAQSSDYESWISVVRPAFEAVALTGRLFTTHDVAREHDLPEPPDPAHHWGGLMALLHSEGVIRLTRVRILTTTNGAYRVRYRLNGRRRSSAALPSRELAEDHVTSLHERFSDTPAAKADTNSAATVQGDEHDQH